MAGTAKRSLVLCALTRSQTSTPDSTSYKKCSYYIVAHEMQFSKLRMSS